MSLTFSISRILEPEPQSPKSSDHDVPQPSSPDSPSPTPSVFSSPEDLSLKSATSLPGILPPKGQQDTQNSRIFMPDCFNHTRIFGSERFLSSGRRLGHPYHSRAPPKHKKPRTSFNKSQVASLEKRFLEQKYLASAERLSLAKNLRMTDSQVKTWFQNRRTKWRRQTAEETEQRRQAACKYFGSNAAGYLTGLQEDLPAGHPASGLYLRPDIQL